ncbi:PilZ domain-containing protein [uncultured Sphingomonas sp.]|uniref:PilZ domain-containing protein n=1 Tax=uncultured Sphingomonas sp. TaxID=158754 RepID=UPI0035CAE639
MAEPPRSFLPAGASPRGAPRHKVFLPAEMTTAEGVMRVHLLNLSPIGALLHGNAPPRAGAAVRLQCGNERWAARVVWVHDKRFGIAHAAPLASALLQRLVDPGGS